jgi:hypothetical protein
MNLVAFATEIKARLVGSHQIHDRPSKETIVRSLRCKFYIHDMQRYRTPLELTCPGLEESPLSEWLIRHPL